MMLKTHEAIDGITYAVQEIDAEITSHIPELKRRKTTPRVMAEVDALLDMRSDLTSVLGGLVINDFEGTMRWVRELDPTTA